MKSLPTIKTKRWNDPIEVDDGYRVLVCRYRPRGLRKQQETWSHWLCDLGPSRSLHSDLYGKHGIPIQWAEFARRYLQEMRDQQEHVAMLARLLLGGEAITLLCSSACVEPRRCHRTILRGLIEEAVALARTSRCEKSGGEV